MATVTLENHDSCFMIRETWTGPVNAVDHYADHGLDAREIADRCNLPVWLVRERFAERALR